MFYELDWSNDSIGMVLLLIGVGDYELIVIDVNGCKVLEKVSVMELDFMILQFDIGVMFCGNSEDGQISVEV